MGIEEQLRRIEIVPPDAKDAPLGLYDKKQLAKLITKEIKQARQDIADEIGKMLEIQGVDGTWNYDPYMHGLYNGMEFCHALVKDVEPKYREAPKQWLADIPTKGIDGSGTTTLNKD